MTSQTAHTKHK